MIKLCKPPNSGRNQMEKPIILTSAIDSANPSEIGTDCECEGGCDGDGACPSPPSQIIKIIDKHQNWQLIQDLQQSKLDDSFTVIFDPLGRTSLAILNESALRILSAFKTPLLINDLPKQVTGLNSEDAKFAVEQMIALGLLQRGDQLFTKLKSRTTTTLTAWLHLTNECNLRCDYCYLRKTAESISFERGQQAIDAVYRSAIAQSFRNVKLKYAGGEATLEFDLILRLHDYAQYKAKELGIGLTGLVLSNGIGLTKVMIDGLRQRNIRLSISLDGLREYHDAQRKFQNGKGSFVSVEHTLERLIKENFIPSITITVSKRNGEGLPEVVEYLLDRNLPFTINFYRENEHSASFEDLAYEDDQMIAAMRKAFAKIENHLPSFSILVAITDRARLNTPHLQSCGVGHSYMVIDQNGNVAKCHMEIERKITDISVPDPLKVIQLDTLGIQNYSVEEKEGCRTCDWRYYCAGGCPALTYRVTGRYDVKSPNCRIYKAIFPEVLRLEGLRILKQANALQA
jgi:uncharacterized protein